MEKQDILNYFSNILEKEKDISAGVAAIMTLIEVLKHDQSATVQELDSILTAAAEAMKNTNYPTAAIVSCCELFLRFVTVTNLDTPSLGECKEIILQRGESLLKKLGECRGKIAKFANDFIFDGSRILTHSKSRVVLQALQDAANANKRFEVFVTMSPNGSGAEMCQALENANIQCTLIVDSAVGYLLGKVDMVMVGAEGIMASGGIINKVGSFAIALCAKEMKKPFYVLTESFKFVRSFPSNQRDVRDDFKYPASKLQTDLSKEHPLVDYTPAAYIKFLITDLGILNPSTVCDDVILYL